MHMISTAFPFAGGGPVRGDGPVRQHPDGVGGGGRPHELPLSERVPVHHLRGLELLRRHLLLLHHHDHHRIW